jgi:hypothetical protein
VDGGGAHSHDLPVLVVGLMCDPVLIGAAGPRYARRLASLTVTCCVSGLLSQLG